MVKVASQKFNSSNWLNTKIFRANFYEPGCIATIDISCVALLYNRNAIENFVGNFSKSSSSYAMTQIPPSSG